MRKNLGENYSPEKNRKTIRTKKQGSVFMDEFLGRLTNIDIGKLMIANGGIVPFESNFSSIDAKYAQATLEEVGQFASWEQLFSLCNRLLQNSMSKWTRFETAEELAIYTVIDWAETVKTDDAALQSDWQEKPMEPQIVINKDFEWFQKNYDKLKKNYNNKWIAIANREIVGHSDSFIDALSIARRKGYKRPFVTRISPEGWGQHK